MIFPKRLQKIWNTVASRITGSAPSEPLSFDQILTLFDEIAAHDDFGLGYPQEPCFARCHLMCEVAFKAGYTPEKAWSIDQEHVWAEGDEKPEQIMQFNMPNGEYVHFWGHTALALPVRTAQGAVEYLVIDPALFDGPVPLLEWGAAIKAPPHFLEIKPFGEPPTNFAGDYDTRASTSKALADPKHARHPRQQIKTFQRFETIPRLVFASAYCRETLFPALGRWPERRGPGWISTDAFPQPPQTPPSPTSPAMRSGPKNGD